MDLSAIALALSGLGSQPSPEGGACEPESSSLGWQHKSLLVSLLCHVFSELSRAPLIWLQQLDNNPLTLQHSMELWP